MDQSPKQSGYRKTCLLEGCPILLVFSLMRIYNAFCKINKLHFHIKFISHLGYNIPYGLLYPICSISLNLLEDLCRKWKCSSYSMWNYVKVIWMSLSNLILYKGEAKSVLYSTFRVTVGILLYIFYSLDNKTTLSFLLLYLCLIYSSKHLKCLQIMAYTEMSDFKNLFYNDRPL